MFGLSVRFTCRDAASASSSPPRLTWTSCRSSPAGVRRVGARCRVCYAAPAPVSRRSSCCGWTASRCRCLRLNMIAAAISSTASTPRGIETTAEWRKKSAAARRATGATTRITRAVGLADWLRYCWR